MSRKDDLAEGAVRARLDWDQDDFYQGFIGGFEAAQAEMAVRAAELTFLTEPQRQILLDIIRELGD